MTTSNQDLCHAWARQHGTSGKSSSMFYDGDMLFSYGRHFMIAKLAWSGSERVALFTRRSYSMTTSIHIGRAHSALYAAGIREISVPDPGETPRDNIAKTIKAIGEIVVKAARARKRGPEYRQQAQSLLDDIREYAKIEGVPFDLPEDLDAVRLSIALEGVA